MFSLSLIKMNKSKLYHSSAYGN